MKRYAILFSLLVGGVLVAQPAPITIKTTAPVSMGVPLAGEEIAPVSVPVVTYTPAVEADPNKFVLTNDVVLMFETNDEVVFTSSPLGIVKVEREAGPIRVRAKFAANPTKIQTRKYDKKWVYTVKPLNEGKCELMTWIVGTTDDTKIQRFAVEVNLGPRPPPVDPDVPPVPTPSANPIPSDKLRVLFTYEDHKTLPKEQRAILDSVLVHNAIAKAGGDWRCWPVNADASQEADWWQKAMAHPRKRPLWVIISSPKGFFEGPLPATYQAMIDLIGKY